MHRRPLLAALADYRCRHPEEEAVVAGVEAFVRRHRRCFDRGLEVGHLTASAWLVDGDGARVLLTHHRKLGRWIQLGGHADGDGDLLRVALREAEEESGLRRLEPLSRGIFDLDVHPIPARPGEAAHLHYDVRYALRAAGPLEVTVSAESHDLAWVPIDALETVTREPSILRMAAKWRARRAGGW
ncbi:MAG: NUDIX domain-containing protein [Acidobacteria bacterium]|nr:MAG: NUDIX domain-containing protein [Acidobacteriota bacterium]